MKWVPFIPFIGQEEAQMLEEHKKDLTRMRRVLLSCNPLKCKLFMIVIAANELNDSLEFVFPWHYEAFIKSILLLASKSKATLFWQLLNEPSIKEHLTRPDTDKFGAKYARIVWEGIL